MGTSHGCQQGNGDNKFHCRGPGRNKLSICSGSSCSYPSHPLDIPQESTEIPSIFRPSSSPEFTPRSRANAVESRRIQILSSVVKPRPREYRVLTTRYSTSQGNLCQAARGTLDVPLAAAVLAALPRVPGRALCWWKSMPADCTLDNMDCRVVLKKSGLRTG
ncbi:hypothetical protein BJX66DRAFT_122096 [Aspergillus keveii]|uniref:Uncharacterized protein n=1 Tax=Aspergillus keveii TaxID=714993 RepID=A0ABR4FJW8_9EURO